MSEFPVEKNVPVPAERRSAPLYPFDEMEVGDSFFVPAIADLTLKNIQNRVSNAASMITRRGKNTSGKKFTVRQMIKGVRCWRIA